MKLEQNLNRFSLGPIYPLGVRFRTKYGNEKCCVQEHGLSLSYQMNFRVHLFLATYRRGPVRFATWGYGWRGYWNSCCDTVSKEISNACYPVAVKMGKEMKEGTLALNVIHGKEMEVEYKKKEIMDKINSFFGYNCISHITLKIVQDKMQFKDKVFPKIKNLSKIEEKMSKIDNKELKSNLNNFLKAFNDRSK